MDNCIGCEYSKFDETLGEYKCLKRCTYLPVVLEAEECPFFKKKKQEVIRENYN